MAGRGLPPLARPEADIRPRRGGRRGRRTRASLSRVRAGRSRQHTQPEDGVVLPRFSAPVRGSVALALCSDGLYALLSGTASGWLQRKVKGTAFRRGQRFVSGGVLIALGAVAAVSGKD